jgi:hypothetical protein
VEQQFVEGAIGRIDVVRASQAFFAFPIGVDGIDREGRYTRADADPACHQ